MNPGRYFETRHQESVCCALVAADGCAPSHLLLLGLHLGELLFRIRLPLLHLVQLLVLGQHLLLLPGDLQQRLHLGEDREREGGGRGKSGEGEREERQRGGEGAREREGRERERGERKRGGEGYDVMDEG